MQPSTAVEEVKPVKVEALPGGDFLYTFPKNFVGTVQIKALSAAAHGSKLTILSGEWLTSTPPRPPPAPPPPPTPPSPPAKCAVAAEGQRVSLGGCPAGHVISDVEFASFGVPKGSCTKGFTVDPSCNSNRSIPVVKAACVGKASCSVEANINVFNGDPCRGQKKQLAVKIVCSTLSEIAYHTVDGAMSTASASNERPWRQVEVPGEMTTRIVIAQTDPLPPLPPAGNGTWPSISSKVQYEGHTLRANNHNDLETAFW
jgi:hypothetical protein